MTNAPTVRRVLLKLSGEALSGEQGFGIDTATLNTVCAEIKLLSETGVQVAVVIGDPTEAVQGVILPGGKVEWLQGIDDRDL